MADNYVNLPVEGGTQSTGAFRDLSNLAAVAFNADIIPNNPNARSIGSATLNLDSVWTNRVLAQNTALVLYTTSDTGHGVGKDIAIQPQPPNDAAAGGNIYLTSGLSGAGGSGGSSGDVQIRTDNNGSGNSGNLLIKVGTSAYTRGKIKFVDGSEGTAGQVWTSTDTSGNGSWAANSAPIGTANTFTGYDNAGSLAPIPGWTFDPVNFGAEVDQTVDPSTFTDTLNFFNIAFNPTVGNSNDANGFQIASRYNTAFSTTGGFTNLQLVQQHYGDGAVAGMTGVFLSQQAGTGVSTGSVTNQMQTINIDTEIATGFTTDSLTGYFHNINSQGTITNGINIMQMGLTGDCGGNAVGFSLGMNTQSSDLTMMALNSTGATVTNQIQGISVVNDTDAANMIMINSNNNGAVSNTYTGIGVGLNANVTGSATMLTLFSQGGTIGAYAGANIGNNSAVSSSITGISFNNNGNAGATSMSQGIFLTDAGDSGGYIGLSINKSGDTVDASKNFEGINMQLIGNTAAGVTGLNINMSGSVPNTSFNATGIKINMSSVTSAKPKIGLDINDGFVGIGGQYNTGTITTSGFFNLHQLTANFIVAAGFPITASESFGVNMASNMSFQDDMGPDGFGGLLGYSCVGYVGSIDVATGKTVDRVNFVIAGASASGGGSGTVTNGSMFVAGGLGIGGAAFTVTNQKGFEVIPGFKSVATNSWGVWVGDTGSDNWFAKNVIVGGSTGQPVSTEALGVTGIVRLNESHIISSQAVASTVAAGSAAGAGASAAVTIAASDIAGQIEFTTGTGSTAGEMAVITFNVAYAVAPIIHLTSASLSGSLIGAYVTSTTAGFSIFAGSAPTDATTHFFNYSVTQVQN